MDWKTGLDNAFSDVLSKRNLLLLALFWGAGLFLLISYGTSLGRLRDADAPATVVGPALAENETGSFSTWRPQVVGQSQLSYRVVFDNLAAVNRSVGVFRSASHKRVHIENLHVTFQAVSASASEGGQSIRLRDFCDLFAPRKRGGSGLGQLGVFDGLDAGETDWSVGVDLANATEVRISDLDWRVHQGDVAILRVQCRFASLRADASRVVLRGHATVTTPEAVLESNCIAMDVNDECFVVDGRYLLTRGEETERGNRGRFDAALGMLRAVSSDTRENRAWADGSQHGPF